VCRDPLSRPPGARPDRFHRVEGTRDLIEGPPRVDADVDRHATRPYEHELLVEAVRHLHHPLQLDALRRDDEGALDEPAGFELADHEPRFYGLTESDLVGEEQPKRLRR